MNRYLFLLLACLLCWTSQAQQQQAQQIEVTGSRKAVRSSGDVLMFITPVAGLAATLALQDWQGLKQEVFTGATAVGLTYVLKHIVEKDRPDMSDHHSFPSMHTTISFAGASFIQRRYGWKWGIPAYALSTYVGWSRVYGKRHDWWDVAAGAAIGVGSGYLFTRPFAKKHHLAISPVAGSGQVGIYASLCF